MEADDNGEQGAGAVEGRGILNNEEATFQMVNRFMGVLTGFTVIAVAMSFGVYFVKQTDVLRVFISATLGWGGYLFAHYSATGKFIHQKQRQHTLPSDWKKVVGGCYGILNIAAGMAIWAVSLNIENITAMILGSFLFLLGYLIAHYEFTGDML